MAARASFEIFSGGDATEFESLADVLLDFFLHVLHHFLGVHKTFGHRVAKKRFALGVEGGNLGRRKLQSLLLLVLEVAAFFAQAFVHLLGLGVSHEGVHLLANALKFRLLDDGFAQFTCFLEDDTFGLDNCFHNNICLLLAQRRHQ